MAGRTSCVDFISSIHGEQRRLEREIAKRDLQAAVKYGLREVGFPHPRTGEPRLKFTYNNIVYITDASATTEVTSWSLVQLPLENAEIDASLARQIAEQKRRLTSGSAAFTSHSVLIVDQSGSMKKSDVAGHRTRSRGAYYTIANEMIAQPLLRDQVSLTDLVSIVEMRDDAVVTILKEPITWELHNKLVELASDPHRPRGQGNYLPALKKAAAVLKSTSDKNCALLLMFLSDGCPSDHSTLFNNIKNSHDLARDAILLEVYLICQPLKERLTFGAFGFAQDVEITREGLKTFDLLRSMVAKANAAGSKAVFSCGLDTESLRKALFTMATSLLVTRTNLSSLAGGSLLRVTTRKVKRTDLEKDAPGSAHYDFHRVTENGLRRIVSRRKYDKATKRETIDWDYVALQHPSAVGIAVKKGYIEQGAERAAYEMTEVTKDNVLVGQPLVGKVSIHEEPSQIEFHQHSAVTQFEAGRLASKFNENLDDLIGQGAIYPIPHIEVLPVWFYDWFDASGAVKALLCEKRLDSERYKKWNDNRGGVFNLNKLLEEPKLGDGDDDNGDLVFAQEEPAAAAADASRIIDEDVPQAFSHWTNQYTRGHSLVCDVQGVLGSSFQLTDPAIHSTSRRFGSTDHGRKGMRMFYSTHECNPLCRVLRLRPPR